MRRLSFFPLALLAAFLWQGCRTTSDYKPVSHQLPSSFAFKREKLAEIDSLIENGMAERRMPGAVLWIERDGVIHRKVYGQRALEPVAEPMTEDTIFDA